MPCKRSHRWATWRICTLRWRGIARAAWPAAALGAAARLRRTDLPLVLRVPAGAREQRHDLGGPAADQLADAMFFLLGPQSAYITGVDLAVDGGLTSGGIFWPVGRAMGAL